jgi:hypothetical protein
MEVGSGSRTAPAAVWTRRALKWRDKAYKYVNPAMKTEFNVIQE